ncbi:MAG: TRAP transporter substrate-binding protein [Petrimonas sp.]|nr:TRAP transporter substrate-binding protein [Petrimonas sp.]
MANAADKPIQIKFGLTVSKTSPYAICCQNFAKMLEEKSQGKFKVDFFYDASVGNDREMQESMLLGELEMGICGPANLTYTVPEYAFFDQPGLFPDRKSCYAFWKTPEAKEISMLLLKAGIRPLSFVENGFYQISNNKHEIKSINDLKGIKIRSMENDIQLISWKNAGAMPSIIPFSEVYLALQQKVLDAQENSIGTFMAMKFYETQPYLTISNRFMHVMTVIVSEAFWKKLSPADQKLLQSCMDDASAAHYDYLTKDVDKMLKELQTKHGIKIAKFSEAEVAKWSTISKPAYEATRKINPKLYDRFMSGVQRTLKSYKK